ncbi:MAG TPA: hypothetical protein VGL53_18135, partial [Bryobacteraceae bacterium]
MHYFEARPASYAGTSMILLKNGLKVDGSKENVGDLWIDSTRIAEGGRAGDCDTVIDCTGLVITPGFIDLHS